MKVMAYPGIKTEARQITHCNRGAVMAWCGGRLTTAEDPAAFIIRNPHGGDRQADLGDWVVLESDGQFYPYKPDTFWRAFDRAVA